MEAKMQYATEEAMKRLTDCTHFLTSPTACERGSECEFRHSEAARSNFRICWYWNNRKCLKPNCTFRHLPLDGVSAGTPREPTEPANLHTDPNKRMIPCYFFQKGQCISSEKCFFVHEYNPTTSNAVQEAKSLPHQAVNNNPQVTSKVSTSLPQLTIPNIIENFPKISLSSYPLDYEYPRSQPIGSVITSNKPHSYQPQLIEEQPPNGRETEYLMERSSPCFDALGDDGEEEYARQSDYYPNQDNYGRRNSNHRPKQNEHDCHHLYHGYKNRMPEKYARDHQTLVERIHERVNRDLISDADKYDEELQQNLSKKRKINGLGGDPYERDKSHADYSYMDHSSRRNTYVSREISPISRLLSRKEVPLSEFRNRERSPRSKLQVSSNEHKYREKSLSLKLQGRMKAPSDEFRYRDRSLSSRLHNKKEVPSTEFRDRERSLSPRLNKIPSTEFKDREGSRGSRLLNQIEVPLNEYRYRETSLSSRLQDQIKVPSNEFRYEDRSRRLRLQSQIEVPLNESEYEDISRRLRLQSQIEVPLTESRAKETSPNEFRDSESGRHRCRRRKCRKKRGRGSRSDRISTTRTNDADPLSFAGPKSLAELKSAKLEHNAVKDGLQNVNPNLW